MSAGTGDEKRHWSPRWPKGPWALLGSGLAPAVPSAKAGGTGHSSDTQRQDRTFLPPAKGREGHRTQHFQQNPLDGSDKSGMEQVPAQLPWISSLENRVKPLLVLCHEHTGT